VTFITCLKKIKQQVHKLLGGDRQTDKLIS